MFRYGHNAARAYRCQSKRPFFDQSREMKERPFCVILRSKRGYYQLECVFLLTYSTIEHMATHVACFDGSYGRAYQHIDNIQSFF